MQTLALKFKLVSAYVFYPDNKSAIRASISNVALNLFDETVHDLREHLQSVRQSKGEYSSREEVSW